MEKHIKFWNKTARKYSLEPVPSQEVYETKLKKTQEYFNPDSVVPSAKGLFSRRRTSPFLSFDSFSVETTKREAIFAFWFRTKNMYGVCKQRSLILEQWDKYLGVRALLGKRVRCIAFTGGGLCGYDFG